MMLDAGFGLATSAIFDFDGREAPWLSIPFKKTYGASPSPR